MFMLIVVLGMDLSTLQLTDPGTWIDLMTGRRLDGLRDIELMNCILKRTDRQMVESERRRRMLAAHLYFDALRLRQLIILSDRLLVAMHIQTAGPRGLFLCCLYSRRNLYVYGNLLFLRSKESYSGYPAYQYHFILREGRIQKLV